MVLWNIDKSRPICPQICEHICVAITNNSIKTNEKLLSIRELAIKIGVNPNTVQKSYEILEEKQVIRSVRGSGWYVCDNISQAIEFVEKMKKEKAEFFIKEMKKLGFSDVELIEYIKTNWGDNNE